MGQFTSGTPFPRTKALATQAFSPDAMLTPIARELTLVAPSPVGPGDEDWGLEFINVAHLQSILEAIDDDGTGFISIKEANNFAMKRPEGWR